MVTNGSLTSAFMNTLGPSASRRLMSPCGKNTAGPTGETLAEQLARAAKEYQEKVLRGLGGLTEAEIEEKLQKFRELHEPVGGTEEEYAAFLGKLQDFERKLRMFVKGESLLTAGNADEEEADKNSHGFLKEQLAVQQAQYQVPEAGEQ